MYSLVIIDDEEELLEGISECFPWENIGFQVDAVFTEARSALEYILTKKPDAVLTDIRLPFMSGLELIQAVKQKEGDDAPLFCILSAYSDFGYAKQALQAGVSDYLTKPVSFDEIESTFREIRRKIAQKKTASPSMETDVNPKIAQAMEIISSNLGECSLKSVAAQVGLNSSYFSRLFKEEMGITFQEYLLSKKMETARQMLEKNIGYKNADITKVLGYQDVQNFCRIFKQYYGMSPNKWRNKRLSDGKEPQDNQDIHKP